MNWDAKNPSVPVDEDGNWLHYPDYCLAQWQTVTPFFDALEVAGMQTGRSSKIVILKDPISGKTYPMFVADLVKGIIEKSLTIRDGKIAAIWTASKRGKNYGIKTVKSAVKK